MGWARAGNFRSVLVQSPLDLELNFHSKPLDYYHFSHFKESILLHTSKPKHIAIVMDGNGRWAESRKLPRLQGHIAGVNTVKKIIQAAIKQKIPVLSLFAFSSENWKRPEEEVTGLMELFLQALQQELNDLHQHQISVRFTGNLTQLTPTLQTHINQAEQLTQHNTGLILNIVMNYGGKWDILQATEQILKKVVAHELSIEDLNESLFTSFLATKNLPDPDLLIRTSGEQRISNFFLWQLAYTELYFSPVYWPDFDESHFHDALQEYEKRQRRFGHIHSESTL